jgi:hypothetical protein
MRQNKSIKNAEHILKTLGICIECHYNSLQINSYDYCYWCKKELMPVGKCHTIFKVDMARNYLEDKGVHLGSPTGERGKAVISVC